MPYASRDNRRGATARYQAKTREWLRQQKMWSPCLDCGGTFPPEAMDFDHVRGEKDRDVSLIISIKRMQAEIAKCDIVCSNCHRARTAFRRQSPIRA